MQRKIPKRQTSTAGLVVLNLKDVPEYLVDIANLEYQGSNKSDYLMALDKCAYDVLNYYADYIKKNLGGN